jgi:hypothetical protein
VHDCDQGGAGAYRRHPNFDGAGWIARVIRIGFAVMNLLLLLSVPSISALTCMIAGITFETIHPRLQRKHPLAQGRLLLFPRP